MSCLDEIVCGKRSIIGINGYGSDCPKPESGLLINNLPFIGLRAAANVANEEQQTGLRLLQESISLSTREVYDEFIAELSPYFNFNIIVETRQLDKFTDQIITGANLERGVVLKRWRSEMAKIFIEEVYIRSNTAGPAKIKVIDGCNTTEYDVTLDNTCVNVFQLDLKTNSEQVKVLFNQNGIDVYNCEYSKHGGMFCGHCGGSKGLTITGWDGSSESTRNCYGVGVKAYVKCYEEEIFCSLIPRMYFLLWYKSGIVFLRNFLSSDRINVTTTYGKERAAELLKEYEAKYEEKYKVVIKSAYNFIKSTKGECLTCNQNRYVQSTP